MGHLSQGGLEVACSDRRNSRPFGARSVAARWRQQDRQHRNAEGLGDGFRGRHGRVLADLEKPGRDPRDEMPQPILKSDVLKMEDPREGMMLKGTVRNVVDFGAFVDIGVKRDGLVHVSEMADRFIKNPLDIVSVGDIVSVKVIGVDMQKGRVKLSMKMN